MALLMQTEDKLARVSLTGLHFKCYNLPFLHSLKLNQTDSKCSERTNVFLLTTVPLAYTSGCMDRRIQLLNEVESDTIHL